jgi:hypothetical protein
MTDCPRHLLDSRRTGLRCAATVSALIPPPGARPPTTSWPAAHSRHKDKRSLDHYTLATPDKQALVIAMKPRGESEP